MTIPHEHQWEKVWLELLDKLWWPYRHCLICHIYEILEWNTDSDGKSFEV
jgi:hypothetical protein